MFDVEYYDPAKPADPDLTGSTQDLDLGLFFANNFARDYARIAKLLQKEIWVRQMIATEMSRSALWAPSDDGWFWEPRSGSIEDERG